jgi:glycosyltransferase involved in cell wall biosynthesis
MNVIFLTLLDIRTIKDSNIYSDLIREFIKNGHKIYVVSPIERKYKKKTYIIEEEECKILKVHIGNIFNTNVIEKGITTILLEQSFIKAIIAFFMPINIDLILYSTPPITFERVIKFIKQKTKAKAYLMLKDIFPQNAIDLKLIKKNGLLYKYFRVKEKRLYDISDYIGTMSTANLNYLIRNNDVLHENVEVCPNSISITEEKIQYDKNKYKIKFNLPADKIIFLYGGNLGKPQSIEFVIKCLKNNANLSDRFFVICGNGTDFNKLQLYINKENPNNVKLIKGLQKDEYNDLLKACDVGLIFLDYRFTIPNFPSRILSYMEYNMPIIACTDINTDVGKVIIEGDFGFWCESNNAEKFREIVDIFCNEKERINEMGENARSYLEKNYTAKNSYSIIMRHF